MANPLNLNVVLSGILFVASVLGLCDPDDADLIRVLALFPLGIGTVVTIVRDEIEVKKRGTLL